MRILIAGKDEDTKNYQAALMACGVSFDVRLEDIDYSLYDRLLLPGGGDIAPEFYGQENAGSYRIDRELDEEQFAAFEAFYKAGKPILGICRGCQIINVALGGDMIQDLPTAESHKQLPEKKDNHHTATSVPGSLMERLYGHEFPINSCHHQGCGKIGERLTVSMRSMDGVAEAIEHVSGRIIGTQWHPERTGFAFLSPEAVDGRKVFDYFLNL